MKRFIFLILIAALALAGVSHDAEAAKKRSSGKKQTQRSRAAQPDRYAAYVIEATTGTVISETNPDRRLYPASLTKMMTLYMTFEAIQNGKLRKNDRIPVSSRAAMQEPSKLGLAPGSTIRVEDAILGLVTKSANDASVVLAEAIGGSEGQFGAMMTRKAAALGMKNSNFVNASGLHNPNQYSSARDMATLGQALIRDFPREYKYFSTQKFTYAGTVHGNHNRLMQTYDGMDGIKTGYVYASGFNLVASAQRNGVRLIGVVFGGQTTVSRNKRMAELLDAGFRSMQDPRLLAQVKQRREMMAAAVNDNGLSAPPTVIAAQQRIAQNERHHQQVEQRTAEITRSIVKAPPVTTQAAKEMPAFNAMGLVTEQGDTDQFADGSRASTPAPVVPAAPAQQLTKSMQPAPPLKIQSPTAKPAQIAAPQTLQAPQQQIASAAAGPYAVQVGAYSTHAASLAALKTVKQKLPAHITGRTQYLIAPLMTNRGMIYRARLSGLQKQDADSACRILQGSCLVMAAQ